MVFMVVYGGALENKDSPEGITYLFKCLDLDARGFLTTTDIHTLQCAAGSANCWFKVTVMWVQRRVAGATVCLGQQSGGVKLMRSDMYFAFWDSRVALFS
ncbi:tonneau 2 (TON2) [Artemisia annua]|uniref:Tonneau 2 (TON2) n=1 Tax=Artemisia annua TaxID=35608 RepID=A0A2U1P9E4_ARTAN|nr:tonneau 2 (TON2) [Artemisia annua]